MTTEAPQDLRTRTTEFALRIIRLYTSLPKSTETLVKAEIVPVKRVEALIKETNELTAIFTTIVTKIKKRMNKR